MGMGRNSFVVAVALALAACATAPQRTAQPAHTGAAGESLHVCPGRVSNAPATNARGRIVDFDPVATVSGVRLMRAPVRSCVSSGFGPRRAGAGSFHHGVDLFTRTPEPIYAGGDGVVEKIATLRGYGRTVLIRHNKNVKTRYAHLSSYARGLSVGDRVSRGALIGRTGDSGNATAVHLHYEILVNGRRRDPLSVGG